MRQAFITVDLGFGDAGKGSIVDFLTRANGAHTIVRYNGGAQAGHRVVTAGKNPREHVFAQFGSGTLAGAATHLSRFMLIDPVAMLEEARHLAALGSDPLRRTTIDAGAPIITPFGRAINRLRELARGNQRHGSCGIGVGETMSDFREYGERVLLAGDLRRPQVVRAKLHFLRELNLAKLDALRETLPDDEQVTRELEPLLDDGWSDWLSEVYGDFARQVTCVAGTYLHTLLRRPGTIIFEGAQGVLLDEWQGFHPYTTWSTTTMHNADLLLQEAGYDGRTTRVGITRAYATRHGAGPLVTEDAALTHALPDHANVYGAWQQGFRVGWPDLVMLRYAHEVAGRLDMLAVTCLDRLASIPSLQVCRSYRSGGAIVDAIHPRQSLAEQELLTRQLERSRPMLEPLRDTAALLDLVASHLDVPIGLLSSGPTAGDKQLLPRA
jgi:adenylosuccinate synthase